MNPVSKKSRRISTPPRACDFRSEKLLRLISVSRIFKSPCASPKCSAKEFLRIIEYFRGTLNRIDVSNPNGLAFTECLVQMPYFLSARIYFEIYLLETSSRPEHFNHSYFFFWGGGGRNSAALLKAEIRSQVLQSAVSHLSLAEAASLLDTQIAV